MSLTKKALDYMKQSGCTAYVAAQKFGISTSTLYAAAGRKRCPHCGHYTEKQIKPEPKSKRISNVTASNPETNDLLDC